MVGELCLRWNNNDLVEELEMDVITIRNRSVCVRNGRLSNSSLSQVRLDLKTGVIFIADFLILYVPVAYAKDIQKYNYKRSDLDRA